MATSHSVVAAAASQAVQHPLTALFVGLLAALFGRSVYRGSRLHALHAIPGPLLPRLTSLWINYHAFIGDECTAVHTLHERYGPIVRTGPNSVDIADGSVLNAIYLDKGGFAKAGFYSNFDMEGHPTIFSSTVPSHRAPRAKAVTALFSTANLRGAATAIEAATRGFVERLGREVDKAKDAQGPFDILPLTRGFALDTVSTYLFGQHYGACAEDLSPPDYSVLGEKLGASNGTASPMSAIGMVDAFVEVGRVWYFPSWAFQWYERIIGTIWPDHHANQSIAYVDHYLQDVVDNSMQNQESTSFPSRLLQAGFSPTEVKAQCMDLVFAGTESTAMNLAVICFNLTKYPNKYETLRKEILEAQPADEELQSLPYLQAVIKEGLRLSLVNPSRLARVVPDSGLRYKDKFISEGTIVSCTPYELHLNPDVFEDPSVFNPERWLTENNPTENMKRDMIAFGHGSRQCIARNLAVAELSKVVSVLAAEDRLRGLENVKGRIRMKQWFNAHVIGDKIELSVLA